MTNHNLTSKLRPTNQSIEYKELERKKKLTVEQSEKREAILKATLDLLVERGFHDTPTSLIAKEAGVATGTLFHHFKNKEELINALYLETKSKMVNTLRKDLITTGSIEDKMKQLWTGSVQWGIMHPKE